MRTIVRNALSGYGFQAVSYSVSLATIPYLVRSLGSEGYGRFAIATAVGMVVSQAIGYGFEISATREIALGIADRTRLGRYAADLVCARSVVGIVALVLVLAASPWIPSVRDDWLLLLGALVLGLSRILGPVWYFHGLERHHHLNAILAAGRLAYAAGLVLLVTGPEDAGIAVGVVAAEALLVRVVGQGVILVECGLGVPTIGEIRRLLTVSIHLFWVRITAVVVSNAGPLIVGVVISEAAAGWYAAAERLALALRGTVLPAANALYPRLAKLVHSDPRAADQLQRLSLVSAVLYGLASLLVVVPLAPWIVAFLYGPDFAESVLILRIGASWPLIYALAMHVTLPVFAQQRFREFSFAVVLASLFYLPTAFFLAELLQHVGVAVANTLAQIASGLLIYRVYRKLKTPADTEDATVGPASSR